MVRPLFLKYIHSGYRSQFINIWSFQTSKVDIYVAIPDWKMKYIVFTDFDNKI